METELLSADSQPREELNILYQDEWLVIIDKPSGLLVHRSEIDRHETRFAMQILRDQIGRYVYPVHRLDKPTSGVLCFALSKEVAQQVTAGWAGAVKCYLGVVRGIIEENGVYDKALKEPWDKYGDKMVNPDKEPQSAVTRFRRLATCELPYTVDRYPTSRYSLVEFTLDQGRRHQIRRHCKSFSHPIIGDTTYGKARHNQLFADHFGNHRLLLHAYSLTLAHPIHQNPITIHAPVSGSFYSVLEQLNWLEALPSVDI
ncbi:pseudouridylate synthase [Hahella sp. CCB-MM4]|uniref:pseudouridine synthase n=1 Tax=Hahella sp. (strain CCB-MM4) TaxID=1926491 RepID=UPI000B9B40C7|nr:pseudouridine synthase [Hahella sp. CCB-MM4]OZG72235.1 pseudouridylate synthase [Hahella sp. CCB-MM4]